MILNKNTINKKICDLNSYTLTEFGTLWVWVLSNLANKGMSRFSSFYRNCTVSDSVLQVFQIKSSFKNGCKILTGYEKYK